MEQAEPPTSDRKQPPSLPEKEKWYFQKAYLLLILGSIGPLGLPVVWLHPSMRRTWKCVITVGVLVLTWLLILLLLLSVRLLQEAWQDLRLLLDH
ncbi:hypothetical protein [Coraliomargarita parva]|uniref:hypothetical protein n=1 Tax=Coraliomargarita parva TaxID=3014050 RepID=UPI0022B361CB|nr:hypothetical protein [Coraliomargarita parva]